MPSLINDIKIYDNVVKILSERVMIPGSASQPIGEMLIRHPKKWDGPKRWDYSLLTRIS